MFRSYKQFIAIYFDIIKHFYTFFDLNQFQKITKCLSKLVYITNIVLKPFFFS